MPCKTVKSLTELIGNTPMLELCNYRTALELPSPIFAKLEYFNPLGSSKDRVALSMIEAAFESGKITQDSTIIEPTSGNTGIGLAYVCACKGLKLILTMPETMSMERRQLLAALGAELVLTDGALGMSGAVERANQLNQQIPGSFIPQQFENPANPRVHVETTAPEIIEAMEGDIDYFVAGIGTGGTISGVGEVLKKRLDSVKIIGVEPAESPLISRGKSAPHGIQGIGANFIPKIMNIKLLDEIIPVKTADAFEVCRILARTEGLLVGISSGAAVWAASEIARRKPGSRIVALLPDSGERYLSSGLYSGR